MKLDIWVPHESKEIHPTQRINTCDMHFKCNAIDPFLKQIITGDEEWIVNRNGTLIKKDHAPSTMNLHKPHQKLSCVKIDHAVNLVGLQGCCVL